jgi:hypothetical protein
MADRGRTRARRRRAGAATLRALVTALVLVGDGGCGPPAEAPLAAPGPTAAASAPAAMRTALLTVEEVRARAAFGLDVRSQPVLDPARPDPATLEGPCGGPLDLPLAGAAVAVFRASFTYTVEATVRVAGAGAVADRLAGRVPPACPPVAGPVGPVDAGGLGERRVAWVEHGDGGRDRWVAVVAAGDALGVLVTEADRALDPVAFAALAATAFGR